MDICNMDVCNDDHDEICFSGRKCPMCKQNKTIKQLEDNINDLTSKLESFDVLF